MSTIQFRACVVSVFVLIATSVFYGGGLRAQSILLGENTPIRFSTDSVARNQFFWTGRFRRVSGDTLYYVLTTKSPATGDVRSIPMASVHSLEVYGKGHRNGGIGLGIGAAAGAVAGFAAGGIVNESGQSTMTDPARMIGGLLGAVAGGVAGFVLGSFVVTPGWVPLKY